MLPAAEGLADGEYYRIVRVFSAEVVNTYAASECLSHRPQVAAWQRRLGVPYLPGSSVKGAVQAWAEQWSDEEAEVEHLFDDTNEAGAGALIVLDALLTKPPSLVVDVMPPPLRRVLQGRQATGDYLSPIPVPFLAVAGREGFRFSLVPRKKWAKEALQRGAELLKKALETIGAGAKTSSGYSTFKVRSWASETLPPPTAVPCRLAAQSPQNNQQIQSRRPQDLLWVSSGYRGYPSYRSQHIT